jgi:activator of HSP90 ATPase
MSYDFTLTAVIPATPRAIYDAWLDSRGHGAMTGSVAKMSGKVGAKVTAWGGYISGKNLELVPGKRIVQSWRTTKFTDAHEDSTITVMLAAIKGGTRLTLRHANVPDGQTSYQKGGWRDHYFRPMQAYFAKQKPAKAKAAKRRPAKRTGVKRRTAKRPKK